MSTSGQPITSDPLAEFRKAVHRIAPHLSPEQVGFIAAEAADMRDGAVEAARERLYDELGRDHHVIFANDGWTVEHSVECRLAGDMTSGCAYWTALKRTGDLTVEPDAEMFGRWRIDLDSEGLPSLTRADQEGAS